MVLGRSKDGGVQHGPGGRGGQVFRRRQGPQPKDAPTSEYRPGGHDPVVITVESGEVAVTVSVRGDLDAHSSPRLRTCLTDLVAQPDVPEVVIDLTEVTFCDSTALGVFVGAHRRLQSDERRLELRGPRPAVRRLFEVSGLDQVLHLT